MIYIKSIQIVFQNSLAKSHGNQRVFIQKTDQLMLYLEVIS